jgi:hypothetical protein
MKFYVPLNEKNTRISTSVTVFQIQTLNGNLALHKENSADCSRILLIWNYGYCRQLVSPVPKPILTPKKNTHTMDIDIHASNGIQTHDPSRLYRVLTMVCNTH